MKRTGNHKKITMAKLNNRIETAIFDLPIQGTPFLKTGFVGPYNITVEFLTNGPGDATVLTNKTGHRVTHLFKWGDELDDYIQKAAEHHSHIVWTTINASDSFKLIHH